MGQISTRFRLCRCRIIALNLQVQAGGQVHAHARRTYPSEVRDLRRVSLVQSRKRRLCMQSLHHLPQQALLQAATFRLAGCSLRYKCVCRHVCRHVCRDVCVGTSRLAVRSVQASKKHRRTYMAARTHAHALACARISSLVHTCAHLVPVKFNRQEQ